MRLTRTADTTTRPQARLPHRLSAPESLRVVAEVLAPIIAQGPVIRRPRALALAARLDATRRGNAVLADLRRRHGSAPVLARVLGRRVVLPLDADDVRRILADTPIPYAPASSEKQAALRHFEPNAVLITPSGKRAPLRALNEAVLDTPRATHRLAGAFHIATNDEARRLLLRSAPAGTLAWDSFHGMFQTLTRRIVLGDGAAHDAELTRLLDLLRRDGNWAYVRPRRARAGEVFSRRLSLHLRRADESSLAGVLAGEAAQRSADVLAADAQVPHWLFAYDAAGIATYNTLALLATHPEAAARARDEIRAADPDDAAAVPTMRFLRACAQEALRLWPTTLVILRQVEQDSELASKGSTLAIVSSFFHRDRETLEFADRFTPDSWLDGRATPARGIVPFSDGAAGCPGRNLVLFTMTSVLAALLRNTRELRLEGSGTLHAADSALPHTLDHSALRITLAGTR